MIALKAKKQILRSQISNVRSRNNERQLERELQRFFDRLGKQVQSNLEEYWSEHLLQGQVDLITKPVMEAQAEYYLILQKYNKREYQLGIQEAQRLVKLSQKNYAHKAIKPRLRRTRDLFATLRGAEEDLLERVFIASQATLTRVDTSIKLLLTEGYQSGKGINHVANLLTKRFDQLTTWESKRIARTEIHNSHNTAVMDTYNEIGVEYTMWIAADDDRTRESHLEINGEIIPMGGTYSNGLKYPGDTDGPIEEWINCRCSNAPYVIPYGYMAPSFSPFREDDLVKVETKDPQQIIDELNKPTEEESWLNGNYEVSTERDDVLHNTNQVYTFDNGVQILINEKAPFTFEEIQEYMLNLPKALQDVQYDTVERIYIRGHSNSSMAGVYEPAFKRVQLFNSTNSTKDKMLDTFNHELAHAFDYTSSGKVWGKGGHFAISHVDNWTKIAEADNKLYAYVRSNGKTRIPNKFPSDYAGKSWLKYKKQYTKKLKDWKKGSQNPALKPKDQRYVEDFAESTKAYLNPKNHEAFVKEFPNRAKYLEELYGKPKFK